MGLSGLQRRIVFTFTCGVLYLLHSYDWKKGFISELNASGDYSDVVKNATSLVPKTARPIFSLTTGDCRRQSETLPAKTREIFRSFQYLMVCFGASVSYWINYGLSYASGQFEGRFAVAVQIVFAVILIALVSRVK
ncbi:hypothetical protein VTK73DRAFT_9906 [Phialemonium thermophilum]|uniref:Uncharacterized protein n=1 Tax=Phialemonium thermophilum TaxID=223376 RepID=A0ABR3XID0_9PEZI